MKKIITLQLISCSLFAGIMVLLDHMQLFSPVSVSAVFGFMAIYNVLITKFVLVKPIKDVSEHDLLTGCHNRVRLESRIPEYEKHETYAVIYFDINNFKQVNDNHGHDDGDLLLIHASNQLRFWFSYGDLYRIGGDEFIVVVPNMPEPELMTMIHKWYALQPTLNKDYNDEFECKFSYGVCYKSEGLTFEDVMNKADEEMYVMKRNTESQQ